MSVSWAPRPICDPSESDSATGLNLRGTVLSNVATGSAPLRRRTSRRGDEFLRFLKQGRQGLPTGAAGSTTSRRRPCVITRSRGTARGGAPSPDSGCGYSQAHELKPENLERPYARMMKPALPRRLPIRRTARSERRSTRRSAADTWVGTRRRWRRRHEWLLLRVAERAVMDVMGWVVIVDGEAAPAPHGGDPDGHREACGRAALGLA
jgi:hypothetical protein